MSNPPRRRQSAAVYRRRRIVVFGGLLAIVLAAVLLIWRPWSQGGGAQTPPPATPPATAPATTGTTPTGDPTFEAADPNAPAPACDPARVTVTALTDKGEYNAEEQPRLSLSLTNGSDADCTIDVGTAHQSFTITSGSDTWWRSTDCQNNPTSQLVTLKAGQTATSAAPLIWDRTRSSAETCNDESRPRAGGGGATYHLSVEVGGITSQSTAQFLLY